MQGYTKHLLIKIFLVILFQVIIISMTELISYYIIAIPHTTLTYILSGAFFGYIVTVSYDKWLEHRRKKVERELKDATDVVLKRFDTDE
ncbi:membrane protein [Bacillus phage Shbh1]|uniref:Putative membrane protein n=1 Tax=Bacillus phage Shbh1 TaxID=1796992 RepID=A0A142F1C6_9CAUD|nr:membrane protein [Bacillus phage Shbh1]AMQ66583.1 putative membrane protein [Bacillus phage Shbh1]